MPVSTASTHDPLFRFHYVCGLPQFSLRSRSPSILSRPKGGLSCSAHRLDGARKQCFFLSELHNSAQCTGAPGGADSETMEDFISFAGIMTHFNGLRVFLSMSSSLSGLNLLK